MSAVDQQEHSAQQSDDDVSQSESPPNPIGNRKAKSLATQKASRAEEASENDSLLPPTASPGRRIVPVHESRIKDRPTKVGEKDSSLKIKIELDLEVEVQLYARVKGDVTIGLM
ncbi:hypothetical protein F5B18DRAFT_655144 [Nemania serpens]|nr:hypothetical protein F5B18DRAFT_655144 [Nemania serpens]